MPKKLAPPTERRLAKKPSQYNSKPFITRIHRLLEERNESYREAALASSSDHQALHRYLTGYRRPHMHACILLADHFGVNPNEFLQLANLSSAQGVRYSDGQRRAVAARGSRCGAGSGAYSRPRCAQGSGRSHAHLAQAILQSVEKCAPQD